MFWGNSQKSYYSAYYSYTKKRRLEEGDWLLKIDLKSDMPSEDFENEVI